MPKAKKPEPPAQLSNLDRLAMVASSAEVRATTDRLEVARLRLKLSELSHELDGQKLAARTQQTTTAARAQISSAEADQEAKQNAHRSLATELGERYAVDWRKASFHPETGDIVRHL